MVDCGSYVTSEFLKIGVHSTLVIIRRQGELVVANWECTCGVIGIVPGLLVPAVLDAGKAHYIKHCEECHP